ncbi:MAG TPA: CHASE2 domain-containing protein [Rhodocyclaceae bacterium]|nr:CHASE2 domain-containing protein [Rhodocyclaceae bacterium]
MSSKKLLEQLLLMAASVLAMIAMWVSPLANLETGPGLRALYAVRGTRPAPQDIVIITMDSISARELGLRNRPNLWPRSLHAQLIDELRLRSAGVIGVDLLFDRARDSADDVRLAKSLSLAGNVVLVESVAREAIKSQQGELLASVDRLVEPLPQFERAALATAPFVLPKTPDGVFAFWSFVPNAGDQPSMPLVLSLSMMPKEYAELVRAWRAASAGSADRDENGNADSGTSGGPLIQSSSELTPEAALDSVPDLLRALRATFNVDELPSARVSMRALHVSPRARSLLQLLVAPEPHALNLYGPIGTIKTIRYRDALSLAADPVMGERMFKGKAVLIGYSEFNQPEQKDAYATPFTTSDGLDISGVELCATALANLLDGSTLHKPLAGPTWFLLIAFSALLTLPWWMKRTHYAVLLTLFMLFAYGAFACYSFSAHTLWLPVAIPLVLQPSIVAVLGLSLHVRRAYRKQHELRQTIRENRIEHK